jgi:hypothetical protein
MYDSFSVWPSVGITVSEEERERRTRQSRNDSDSRLRNIEPDRHSEKRYQAERDKRIKGA